METYGSIAKEIVIQSEFREPIYSEKYCEKLDDLKKAVLKMRL